MKKSGKKQPERRKKPRNTASAKKADQSEVCLNCSKSLKGNGRALYVEEEIGRVFCGEPCIAEYFTPEIERLEKEFFRKLSPSDLSAEERENLAHLRWVTLQEPDEVWREKTLSGDYRYTLISEFQPSQKKVWTICICLMLRGEPSFLYLAFPTKNAAMVAAYRRGEQIEIPRGPSKKKNAAASDADSETPESPSDRLADSWTEEETFRAQTLNERMDDDIPFEEFSNYEKLVEKTLDSPDEVWSTQTGGKDSPKVYHFIRRFRVSDTDEGEANIDVWYLIIARETEQDDEQIEILDAFPTRDQNLVDRYRRGEQEVGENEASAANVRVLH